MSTTAEKLTSLSAAKEVFDSNTFTGEEYNLFMELLNSTSMTDESYLEFLSLVGDSGNVFMFKQALSKIKLFGDSKNVDEIEKVKLLTLLRSREDLLKSHFSIEKLYFDVSLANTANIVQEYIVSQEFTASQKRQLLRILADNGCDKILSALFEREIYSNGPKIIGNDIDVVYKSLANAPILLFVDDARGTASYCDSLIAYQNQVEELQSKSRVGKTYAEKLSNFDASVLASVVANWGSDVDLYKVLQNPTTDVEALARNLKTPNKILYLAKYLTSKNTPVVLDSDTLSRVLGNLSHNIQYSKNLKPSVFVPFLDIDGTNARGVSIALACSTEENFDLLERNNVELLQILDKPGIAHDCMADVFDRVGSNEVVSHYLLFYTPDADDMSEEARNRRFVLNELYAGRCSSDFVELMDVKAEKFDGASIDDIEAYKQSELLRLRKEQAKAKISRGDDSSEISKTWLSKQEREVVHDAILEADALFKA